MANQDAVRQVISPDYVGTVEAEATDVANQVKVRLGVRSEVTEVVALQENSTIRSEAGLRQAVFEAANRAEAERVMNELALLDAFDPEHPSSGDAALAPLPGRIAPRLVVRSPDEQADHLARYINGGGLEPITAPGTHRKFSSNGYLSLAFNERGQLTAIEVDQEWLYAASLSRLNNALKEAVAQ